MDEVERAWMEFHGNPTGDYARMSADQTWAFKNYFYGGFRAGVRLLFERVRNQCQEVAGITDLATDEMIRVQEDLLGLADGDEYEEGDV